MRRIALAFLLAASCHRAPSGAPAPSVSAVPEVVVVAPDHAEIGKLAPDFELEDLEGNAVKLSEFRGKIVVLEWFNPGCPFVKIAHRYEGSLERMAKLEAEKGVVWLAINSAGPGRQGYGKKANVEATRAWDLQHPILLDEKGTVGKTYGATNTPHMFVIDAKGTLVYAGAIDDTHGGELEPDEKKVNYVEQALAAVRAGKPVATPQTKAWGCSVKYAP